LLPKRSKKARKVASLPYRQMPALYASLMAVDDGPGLTASRVLRFLILTGVRLKEGRGARLSEVDYDKRGDDDECLGAIFTIPASRMKIKDDDFEVPLSAEALDVIREMGDDNAVRGVGNDGYIFPGRWVDKCIGRNAVHLALARLQGKKGKPRWLDERGRKITVHGFRATFATWAQEQRRDDGSRLYDQDLIDAALAHSLGGVTGAYQRSQHLAARKMLMTAWSDFVTGA
jgi:integrase